MPQTRPKSTRTTAPSPPLPLSSGPAAPSLKAAVEAVVEEATRKLWWKLYGFEHKGLTKERVKSDIWTSPEGKLLAELSRCPYAGKPVSEALRLIAGKPEEAKRYAAGLRLLREGIPLP